MKTAIIACILALTACGTQAPKVAPTSGCTQTTTQELFVKNLYRCPDNTNLYTFDTTKARDSWTQIATNFGIVVVSSGETWLTVKLNGLDHHDHSPQLRRNPLQCHRHTGQPGHNVFIHNGLPVIK